MSDATEGADHRYLVAILSYGDPTPAGALATRLVDDGVPLDAVLVLVNPRGTPSESAPALERFRTVRFFRNLGYAAAMNEALLRAHSDGYPVAVLLTHDVEIGRAELDLLADALETNPDYALVGPVMLDPGGAIFSAGGTRSGGSIAHVTTVPTVPLSPSDWLDGAVVAARVPIVGATGLDDRFFLYCEDVDLGFRLNRAGWRVGVVAAATARQQHLAAGRRRAFGYLRTRNLLEAFWKDRAIAAVGHYALRLLHGLARGRGVGSPELLGAWHFVRRRFGPPPARLLSGSDIASTE